MKKILIFSTGYFPFVGGAEIAVKEITDRLGSEYEFDLITAKMRPGLASKERIGNVMVYRLGLGISALDKSILPIWGAFKAIRLNKKQNYQYFWGIMVTFASLAGYIANGILGLFGKRKKMILTLQEGDSEEHLKHSRGGLINFSWKFTIKRTDIMTAISNYLLERGKGFGFKGESYLIPNGVDRKSFEFEVFSGEQRIEMRHKLGLNEQDIVLVTTSRLVKKNAVTDLLDSLTLLPDNIKFLIIGTGPLESNLKLKTKNLKLDSRVFFLGQVDYKNIPKYLKISDIFIRPSLSEGMGNSFIEAMAAGLPVIATPVGGIVDFLEHEKTGLFCEVQNPQSIAEQVKKYLENPALRAQIVIQAENMVRDKYDWNIIVEKMKLSVFK
jgi:glycosyltransferase involved in cell wall biosynthesis